MTTEMAQVAGDGARIVRVEMGYLDGQRPRPAGSNARLGEHGSAVRVPIVRLTTDDGATGFGACRADRRALAAVLGTPLHDLFADDRGAVGLGRACEFPLWDLIGGRAGTPVYALAAAVVGAGVPPSLRVPCYDTSLYFDDLHLASDAEAADLIAAEAKEGVDRGHRAFKIKVGRGARHLPLEQGTRRDIAVVAAVRDAVGRDATIMVDANNGYNLNLAKRVLTETAACGIHWLEEAFHEDAVLYRDLREWQEREGLPVLIADGEGDASPGLMTWAREHLVNVVQYDIFGHGFTGWLATGARLDDWGVASAPHHYGTAYGNYAACHLAGAIRGLAYVEWDAAAVPGLDASGYGIDDGRVSVPGQPGFGLVLDESRFRASVEETGFRLGVG
jgi:L-alanine-DL-glutamate epimerase-like enolase superfamily enzyme